MTIVCQTKNNDTGEKEDEEFENMLKQAREEKSKKTGREKKPKSFSTAATRITAKPLAIISRQQITDARSDAENFGRERWTWLNVIQINKFFCN